MPEHDYCKGCKWNNYPICNGIKMEDDTLMNIENLRPSFECIVKFQDEGIGFIKNKTELKLIQEKNQELEARLLALESK